ncbi:hypothetical protein PMIN02_010726 [Paraphaeosphaeria minitans]
MTYEEDLFIQAYPKNPWSAPNNATHHMERLATVITNAMRETSNDTVLGNAYNMEFYIGTRWVWLTLPIGLLGLSLLFLAGTVIHTSMENDRSIGVWKNSSIATLLYGLPDEMQRKITDSQAHGTPRTKVKELNVRMLPTKNWRISGYVLSPIARNSRPPPGRI